MSVKPEGEKVKVNTSDYDKGSPYDKRLPANLQESLLVLLAFRDDEAKRIRNAIDLSLFEGHWRKVATQIYAYLDEHQCAPGIHLSDLFEAELNSDDKKKAGFHEEILQQIYDANDRVNPQFVMEGMAHFLSIQTMKRGTMDAAEKLEAERPAGEVLQTLQAVVSEAHKALATGGTKEPLDLIGLPEVTGWPKLTKKCLPTTLYDCATNEARRLKVDPCAIATYMLAACAASISDAWQGKAKHDDYWTQQPRLWVCIVKDVGARGTDMLKAAFWPLQDRDRRQHATWQQQHAAWKKRHPGRRKEEDIEDDPEPKEPRIISNDPTVESARDILAVTEPYNKLTLYCDELVVFFGNFDRYSNKGAAGRAQWLEAYEGGPHRIDRVGKGSIYVPNWSVNIAGNIQPRRLLGMAKNLIDDGMFQRFVTIHTRPDRDKDDESFEFPPSSKRSYGKLHMKLARLEPEFDGSEPRPAAFTWQAEELYRDFMAQANRIRDDETLPNIIREAAAKWSGLVVRLSLIFHLVEQAEKMPDKKKGKEVDKLHLIQSRTVRKAVNFINQIVRPNLYRLGFETMPEEGTPDTQARWIAGHILAHAIHSITAHEIGRAYKPLRGKELECQRVMAILADANWVHAVESGRRDSKRWNVNPLVHDRFAEAAEAERQRRAEIVEDIRKKS